MRKRTLWLTLAACAVGLTVGVSALAGWPIFIPDPNDCRFVLCAYPDCGPNEHTEIPEGQCCPVCVPN